MSADDGIYLAKFNDGWRVIHAQAIENIFHSREDVYLYFHHAPLFKTEKQAFKYANKLFWDLKRKEGMIVEYGISSLGHLGDLNAKTKVRKHGHTTKARKKK